ncbi:hypothetical protein [Acidomonas methanolica]|uniref:hypothetical protein n=1 Tax=Acidomonas methanolica TaxID=437 RepID=UPI002119E62C|nr:hypothetical protein [Acidomonas methanolica]MCQ9156180.1 hypothetical protein [Acidomonas methanolica]
MKSIFLDDQINARPNELRLFAVASVISPGTGAIAMETSVWIRLFPNDDTFTFLPGFLAGCIWAGYCQFSLRRALQMKDTGRRVELLKKLRLFPAVSLILGPLGFVASIISLILHPANAGASFYGGAIPALSCGVCGGLSALLALKARRIPWLVNPI